MGIKKADDKMLAIAFGAKVIMDEAVDRLHNLAEQYGVSGDTVVIAALMAGLDDYGEVHIVGNKY